MILSEPRLKKRSKSKIGEVMHMSTSNVALYYIQIVNSGSKMFGPFVSRRELRNAYKFLELAELWEDGQCVLKN